MQFISFALFAQAAYSQSLIASLNFESSSLSLSTSVSVDGSQFLNLALDLQSTTSWVCAQSLSQNDSAIHTEGLGTSPRPGSAFQKPSSSSLGYTNTSASPPQPTFALYPGSRLQLNSTASPSKLNQTLPGSNSAFTALNPIDNSTVTGIQKTSTVFVAGIQVSALVGVVHNGAAAISSQSASQQPSPSASPAVQPGVVGLGMSGGTSSFLQALVSSGKIDSPAYSIYVNPANPAAGSQLIFGSNTETTLYSGSLCSVPFTDMNTMQFPVSAVSLAGDSGTSQIAISTSSVQAVLSTTTNFVLLPETLLSVLVSSVSNETPSKSPSPAMNNLSSLSSQSFCHGLPHQLALSIGGVVIQVPLTSTLNGTCTLTIGLSPTNYMTLGIPFFQQAYTHVNIAKGIIGVAPSVASSSLVDISASSITSAPAAGNSLAPTPAANNANAFYTMTVTEAVPQEINVYVTIDSCATIVVPYWDSSLQTTSTSNIVAATPGVYTIGANALPQVYTLTSTVVSAIVQTITPVMNNAAQLASSSIPTTSSPVSTSSEPVRTMAPISAVAYMVATKVLVINSSSTQTRSLTPPTPSPKPLGAIQSGSSIPTNTSVNAVSAFQLPSLSAVAAVASPSPSSVPLAAPTAGSAIASPVNGTAAPSNSSLFQGNASGLGVGKSALIFSVLVVSLCIL